MNLKERGITIGDLLVILIVILTSITVFKTLNKDKKTSLIYNIQEIKISHENLNHKLI